VSSGGAKRLVLVGEWVGDVRAGVVGAKRRG